MGPPVLSSRMFHGMVPPASACAIVVLSAARLPVQMYSAWYSVTGPIPARSPVAPISGYIPASPMTS